MICELDIGNTNCKWRLVDLEGHQAASGAAATASSVQELATISDTPERVRISSVAGQEIDSSVQAWVTDNWRILPEFAHTLAAHAGVTIAYQIPNRLGVDRWLAMLAAFKEFGGPVCVMDLGSAFTIDLLDDAGLHLGGYIVPGLKLQEHVLLNETGRITMGDPVLAEKKVWGQSSEECISFGIRRMLSSFIESVIGELSEQSPGLTICVAGGSASLVPQAIAGGVTVAVRPDLVLDGLSIALP